MNEIFQSGEMLLPVAEHRAAAAIADRFRDVGGDHLVALPVIREELP